MHIAKVEWVYFFLYEPLVAPSDRRIGDSRRDLYYSPHAYVELLESLHNAARSVRAYF